MVGMQLFQVDAFTTKRFTGNPATVILDAEGQSDASLAAIAREFAHAETAFVLPPDAADHDVRVRFFNARKEAPFVGHASVAVHTVLLATKRRSVGILRQKSGTGILEVRAETGNAAAPFIEFRQGAPQMSEPLTLQDALRVAQALGVPGESLHERFPARITRKGSSRLLLALSNPDVLDRIEPRFEQILALGREFGADGFFAFGLMRGVGGTRTYSRMFCPALGIPEDPVSGNAHCMLAAYLWDLQQLNAADPRFVGFQGEQMQRPGQVHVSLDIESGAMRAARIGGHAVIVSDGRLV